MKHALPAVVAHQNGAEAHAVAAHDDVQQLPPPMPPAAVPYDQVHAAPEPESLASAVQHTAAAALPAVAPAWESQPAPWDIEDIELSQDQPVPVPTLPVILQEPVVHAAPFMHHQLEPSYPQPVHLQLEQQAEVGAHLGLSAASHTSESHDVVHDVVPAAASETVPASADSAHVHELLQQVAVLRANCEAAEAGKQDLAQQVDALQQERMQLQAQLQALEAASSSSATGLQAELSELRAQLAATASMHEQSAQELAEWKQLAAELREQLEARAHELEAARAAVAAAEARAAEMEDAAQHARGMAAEATSAHAEVEKKLAAVEQALQEAHAASGAMQQQVEDTEKKYEALREKHAHAKAEFDKLKAVAAERKKALAQHKAQVRLHVHVDMGLLPRRVLPLFGTWVWIRVVWKVCGRACMVMRTTHCIQVACAQWRTVAVHIMLLQSSLKQHDMHGHCALGFVSIAQHQLAACTSPCAALAQLLATLRGLHSVPCTVTWLTD